MIESGSIQITKKEMIDNPLLVYKDIWLNRIGKAGGPVRTGIIPSMLKGYKYAAEYDKTKAILTVSWNPIREGKVVCSPGA